MRRTLRTGQIRSARWFAVSAIAVALLFAACGEATSESYPAEQEMAEKRYYHYAINADDDMLDEKEFKPGSTETGALIEELIGYCTDTEELEKGEHALLSDGLVLQSHALTDGVMTLDLSEDYAQLPKADELLVRAGLVKTFTQVEGISYVEFKIGGVPMKDSSGEPVGRLSQDNFVENSGRSIHSYQNVIMKLYYTDESGTVLMPEERSVYFNSNEPLEKAVLTELIRGTSKKGYFPTLLPETKVLSVAIQEGICYVNFDESFRNSILSVQEDVQIYSIVNSLVDTCNVSRVQFTVNGKSNMTFRESMELDRLYEKNELLEVGPSE